MFSSSAADFADGGARPVRLRKRRRPLAVAAPAVVRTTVARVAVLLLCGPRPVARRAAAARASPVAVCLRHPRHMYDRYTSGTVAVAPTF